MSRAAESVKAVSEVADRAARPIMAGVTLRGTEAPARRMGGSRGL